MTGTAMTPINLDNPPAPGRRCAVALLLTLLGGCAGLLPKPPPPPALYALDGGPAKRAPAHAAPAATGATAAVGARAASAPTLIVEPPRAAAGYDSTRIVYLRTPLRLEHYAHSEWVDTPARQLAPVLVAAVERTGTFGAVTQAPGSAAGELRLSTELLRLQHDFTVAPSQVHMTLRASLIDHKTRRVLAARQFDHSVAADSEDAYGGVVAAHRAMQTVLDELAVFAADAAGRWSASTASSLPLATSGQPGRPIEFLNAEERRTPR